MKMIGWFTAIIVSLLLAWALPRFFKSHKASQISTIVVGAGWLLWTGGISTFVIGYSLTGPLLGAQLAFIVSVCFVILFLTWLYNYQKNKQLMLKEANTILNKNLSDLSEEFNASINNDLTSNRIIKGASGHRKELFNQISATRKSLIILSGWANDFGIDRQTKKKLIYLLQNDIMLTLGWGYKKSNNEPLLVTNAEKWLKEQRSKYPSNLKLLYFQNHSKAIIRDDEEAVIGSFNWLSNSGHSKNDELSLVITDKKTITTLRDTIRAHNSN